MRAPAISSTKGRHGLYSDLAHSPRVTLQRPLEALQEEPPHLQVPRSPTRPWRVGARGLGNHPETPAEFSEEFGSQARALAFVPVHGRIHLMDSLGVELETNPHRR
jgi:hypothetical protein